MCLAMANAVAPSFMRALYLLQHDKVWSVAMTVRKRHVHLLRRRTRMQFVGVEKMQGRQSPSRQSTLHPLRHRFLEKALDRAVLPLW